MKTTIAVLTIIVAFFVLQVYTTANCRATGPGRYVEPTDTTCKNYTFCVYISSSNSYLAFNYVCPLTSLFNPNTGLCTTDYTCPNSATG